MNTLSLTPRFDLFRFMFPKDFLPKEIEEKYTNIINKDKSVITTPIDYLNESIQGISIPGISDLLIEQDQHSQHVESETHRTKGFINVDTTRRNATYSTSNPLTNIETEITVTFRQNQGLYNYFMLYETIFYKVCKQYDYREKDDVFVIELLDETGIVSAKITLFQPRIQGIDGLNFNYNKTERNNETFDVKFRFNNIDFDLV